MAASREIFSENHNGARLLVLENEHLKVSISPDKGSDIVEITHKKNGSNLLFSSPLGFRSLGIGKASIDTPDTSFYDYYEGGWQDVLPNPGRASNHRGASWGLHGETPLLPWKARILDDGEAAIVELSVQCVRYPLRVSKRVMLRRDESKLIVKEIVSNLAEQEIEFAWLQHIAFGQPLIGAGMFLDLRAKDTVTVDLKQTRLVADKHFTWPTAPARNGSDIDLHVSPPLERRFEDEVVVTMGEPWYALRNTTLDLTAAVSWSAELYKYLWFWLNSGSLDYPWFGRVRVLGLEPCSNIPDTGLSGYAKEKTVLRLEPDESLESQTVFSTHEGSTPVRHVSENGDVAT